MSTKPLFIILGNQLFPLNEISSYKDSYFLMAEDFELCTYEKHHKHKLILFLSSMRKYSSELKSKKFNVTYYQFNKKNINLTYEDKLSEFIKSKNISEINMFEVEDKFFEKRILRFCKKNNIKINFLESPMFLNTRSDFKKYLSKVKKPFTWRKKWQKEWENVLYCSKKCSKKK